MTTPSIVEFLRARLQEDEDTARATLIDVHGSGDWRADKQPVVFAAQPRPLRPWNDGGWQDDSRGVHTSGLYRVRDANARPVVEEVRSLVDDDDPHNITEYVNGAAVSQFIARPDPARVLREVEAKQAIVEQHPVGDLGYCMNCWANRTPQSMEAPCLTLRNLAAVYSGHPDYREEWKP